MSNRKNAPQVQLASGAECGRAVCGVGTTWDVVHVGGAVGEGAVGLACGRVGHDGIELGQGNIAERIEMSRFPTN